MRGKTKHGTGDVSRTSNTNRKQGGATLDAKTGEQKSIQNRNIGQRRNFRSGTRGGRRSFDDPGQMSSKTFMLPDKRTHRATKKMLLKHNLREGAREINIVPGLHTTLISVPKLADANYVTIFNKDEATIYDRTTTNIRTTHPPILTAP